MRAGSTALFLDGESAGLSAEMTVTTSTIRFVAAAAINDMPVMLRV